MKRVEQRINIYYNPDGRNGLKRKGMMENAMNWLKEKKGQDFHYSEGKFWWAVLEVFDYAAKKWEKDKLEVEMRQKELGGFK